MERAVAVNSDDGGLPSPNLCGFYVRYWPPEVCTFVTSDFVAAGQRLSGAPQIPNGFTKCTPALGDASRKRWNIQNGSRPLDWLEHGVSDEARWAWA